MRMLPLTYFATWPNWSARCVLAAMALLVVLAAILSPARDVAHLRQFYVVCTPGRVSPGCPGAADIVLYRAIEEHVLRGEGYYASAAAEQRARSYPTAPAMVFREPTLAWIVAALGNNTVRRAVMVALSLVAFVALRNALAQSAISGGIRIFAIPLIGTGLAVAWIADSYYVHEVWASLLIAISLGTYRPNRWHLSVLSGVAACLFRELALPCLMVMAAFALFEKRYRELAGWIAGMTVFGALYTWHLSVAGALHHPGDLTSPGWIFFGGWPLVLDAAKLNPALIFAPNPAVAVVVCLALIGLAGLRDPWVARLAVIVGGYLASFLVVGRPDSSYWGLLISPLLPIGVALSPVSLRDLVARAWAPHPAPIHIAHFARVWRAWRGRYASNRSG